MTFSELKGPHKFGPYTLIRRLAVGGMSEIWLAEQKGIGGFTKRVVIKTILEFLSEDPELVEMFLDEGRIAAGLTHPNIAQIYDLGQIGDSYYLSMEYVHGRDLRYWLTANFGDEKIVPLNLILRVAADVCAGLHYAHAWKGPDGKPTNIVHRDISPDNIICTFEGNVKIVDFGIAKASHQAKTKTGVLKGKYAYMSPEQVNGFHLDRRSDLFSLGVVMYELIAGRRLFKRDSEVGTLEAVSDAIVPPLSGIEADVPAMVEDIIMRALMQHPDNRFQNARDMQMAIEKAMVDLNLLATTSDLSMFMHEMFDEEEILDTDDAVEMEKSMAGAPDVTTSEPALSDTSPAKLRAAGKAAARESTRPSSWPEGQDGEPVGTEEEEPEHTPSDVLAQTVSDLPWEIQEDEFSGEVSLTDPDKPTLERTVDDAEPPRSVPVWFYTVLGVLAAAGGWLTYSLIAEKAGGSRNESGPGIHQAGDSGFRSRYAGNPTDLPSPPVTLRPDAGTAVAESSPDAGKPDNGKASVTASDEIIAAYSPGDDNPGSRNPPKKRRKKKRLRTKVGSRPKRWCGKTYDSGYGKVDVGFLGGWGVVHIDGEKIRYTPVVEYSLHAGRHGIELKDKEGSIIRKWCIRLRKGQHVKLLHQ